MSEIIDEQALLTIAKFKCKQKLLFFTRYFYKKRYNRKFIVNSHHEIICDALEKVLKGEITRLIINIAPRYSKTELAVKNFIAHGLALNASAKFIHLTYANNLALDNSEDTKDIIENEHYQKLFDVKIKKDSKAKNKWYTTVGGGVYAAAAGGQVTGFGAGKVDEINDDDFKEFIPCFSDKKLFGGAIIIDDPNKPEDAHSILKRMRVNERFDSTIRNRVNSRDTPIIVIQQRLHPQDLSGYLMEIEDGVWHVLTMPCLKENGTALWEMKHSVKELMELKRINQYVFESQYQQSPKKIKKGATFYKLFSYDKNTASLNYNPDLSLHITFDFNVNPYMTCCIWQILIVNKKDILKYNEWKDFLTQKGFNVTHDTLKIAIQIDEICTSSPKNTTSATCQEFKHKFPNHNGGMYVYGDPNGNRQDTRAEKGHNDYTIIVRELQQYKPQQRVLPKAPSVSMRGSFINSTFENGYDGLYFLINPKCTNTVGDYLYLKEDSDGTKLKKRITDPITGVSYEEYGHTSDANDYFKCYAFASEFSNYQKVSKGLNFTYGKNEHKHSY